MEENREGHRERIRKVFLEQGIEKMTDEQILELLLTFGQPRKDCKLLARALLKEFKTLAAVLEADVTQLNAIKGVGPNNVIGIKFTHQVARYYLRERMRELNCIASVNDVINFLKHSMMDSGSEFCKGIYLDSGNRMLHEETIADGTANMVHINTRKVAENALRNNTAAIILAHNHPGGDPSPSDNDKVVTQELVLICQILNITFHDHIIISGTSYYSFAEHGLIQQMEKKAEDLKSNSKMFG